MTLRQVVPASLLAGRKVVVLVCYLDDSGKDSQNTVTGIAGYIARDIDWEKFETNVEPWFAKSHVNVLHAVDLKRTQGEFKNWSFLKKQAFVARICLERNPRVMLGMSMSVEKSTYAEWRKQQGRKRTNSPYTFCFNVIVDWIFRDIRLGPSSNSEGVAFIIESGHENNDEAEKVFHAIRKYHGLESLMHSVSFVPKESSRAIQLADLFAYYSRRDHVALLRAVKDGKTKYPTDTMLRLITDGMPHRGYVATGFDQNGSGTPYLPERLV